jgi:hypothetical protein
MNPIEAELYRAATEDPELADGLMDVFARTRAMSDVLTLRLRARFAIRALKRSEGQRRQTLRIALREALAG